MKHKRFTKFYAVINHHSQLTCIVLLILTLLSVSAVFTFLPPIPQSNSYHHFADRQAEWGIMNFADVISNLLFLLISILGFSALRKQWKDHCLTLEEAIVFSLLFTGVLLVSFGSAYYHWSPNNTSLVWDRLSLTIVFMSILSLTLMERINLRWGFWLLIPLLSLGVFSVLYWHWTEILGSGDLRLYGLVQFYSMFLIVIILIIFPKPYPSTKAYVWMLIFYALSKLAEFADLRIYQLAHHFLSGNTLKHLLAAISLYATVIFVKEKQPLFPPQH